MTCLILSVSFLTLQALNGFCNNVIPNGAEKLRSALQNFLRGDLMGYVLTCDDGDFYFDDIDEAIEYGEQNCPRGYDIEEIFD